MSGLRREFTKREKILLLFFVLLLILLGYFKLILEPINDRIAEFDAAAMQEQIKVDENYTSLLELRKMERQLAEWKEAGIEKTVPLYDNKNALIMELHSILAQAEEYSLQFDTAEQVDYMMLRPVSMSFRAADYAKARKIINSLHDSSNVNLISDLSMTTDQGGNRGVEISLNITYYEVVKQ